MGENCLYKNPKNDHKSARGPHRRDVTHILPKVNCFFIQIVSFSLVTETIGFFSHRNSYVLNVTQHMPMIADAHISSLGYLWQHSLRIERGREQWFLQGDTEMQEGDQKGHWRNNFLCSGNQSSLTA